MMRQILNFFITGFVIWVAAWLFPNHVRIDGLAALVIVTLLYYILLSLVALVCFGLIVLRVWRNNSFSTGALIAMVVALFVIMAVAGFLVFLLLDYLLDGFWLSSIPAAILLAFATSIFTINYRRDARQ